MPESVLERALLQLVRRHALPVPALQYDIVDDPSAVTRSILAVLGRERAQIVRRHDQE